MADAPRPLILIVDDDRAGVRLLSQLLSREDYQLEFAENGESGLAKARQIQPDLILLDVVMPDIDGFEVCRRVRADPMLAEVPVLMLTALEDDPSRLAGIEAGADDFISKPYRAAELRARVRTVTRLNRYRRIRAERARFGWVVENADDGYLLVDQGGSLLYANGKARNIFGIADGDASERDVLALIQRQFQLQPPEGWADWPNLGSQSLHLIRPESSRAPAVWLAVQALSHSLGQEREVLLQLRDVTAEMASQRSVWSFEALISHKLRTPLTKIVWGITFIAQKADKLSAEKIKDFAAMARTGVNELQRELDDVLGYLNAPTARPGGPGFSLKELESVLFEIVAQLEIKPIIPYFQAPLAESIFCSSRAFKLILWELLHNSKKFHPKHQPDMHIQVRQEGQKVVFEFHDDGVCLSPEQLKKAFLPYYQGERNFTGQVPGMGLGLSMISSLVWEVGGECSLRNREDGEGVVVVLKIPGA